MALCLSKQELMVALGKIISIPSTGFKVMLMEVLLLFLYKPYIFDYRQTTHYPTNNRRKWVT